MRGGLASFLEGISFLRFENEKVQDLLGPVVAPLDRRGDGGKQ